MKTALIMAGGTGGHIFPGLAVAENLRARGWQVKWLGNPDGMEARLVPPHSIEMLWLRFGALRGKGWLRKLFLPLSLLVAFWQALRLLRRHRPCVVVGFGGYISFPGGMMAVLTACPLVVHEQNSVAGLANRVLAMVAERVLMGFPTALRGGVWVGNPVRPDIAALAAPAVRFAGRSDPLRLLVLGGSLGASILNQIIPQALAALPIETRPKVVHQAGASQLEQLRESYAAAGVTGELLAFIEEMPQYYAAADLVICRAGASTIAELAAVGVASVLVPYPHAVDDHQTSNAQFLVDCGAAVLLPQAQLTAASLASLLRGLGREKLLEMASRARAQARPDAAASVADACEQLCKERAS